ARSFVADGLANRFPGGPVALAGRERPTVGNLLADEHRQVAFHLELVALFDEGVAPGDAWPVFLIILDDFGRAAQVGVGAAGPPVRRVQAGGELEMHGQKLPDRIPVLVIALVVLPDKTR